MNQERAAFARLLFIDREIAKGNYPNANTLAREWDGVSDRTIKRDIQWLRDFQNAPIEYDPQRRGYYYSEPSFRLPALHIGANELFALTISGEVLRQYQNTPLYKTLDQVFRKLTALVPENVTVDPRWLDNKLTVFHSPLSQIKPDVWDCTLQAVREQRRLHIQYSTPKYRDAVAKRIDPYHVVAHRGEWYMIGHDEEKEDTRIFAVSRIRSATLGDQRFELPEDFDPLRYVDPHFGVYPDGPKQEIRIHFSASLAPYIRERTWHSTQRMEEHEDNSLTLTFRTNQLLEVQSWILSWGHGCQVLEPQELVDSVRSELGQMIRNYTSDSAAS